MWSTRKLAPPPSLLIKTLCSICVISGYFDHNIVMILYRNVHDKLTLLCCGLDSGCLPCDSLTHRLRYLPQTLKHCTLIYIHYVLRSNPTSSCFSIQLLNLWGFVWPQLDKHCSSRYLFFICICFWYYLYIYYIYTIYYIIYYLSN